MKRMGLTVMIAFSSLGVSSPCRGGELKHVTFESVAYRIYVADPAEIELHWKDPATHQPYRSFAALERALHKRGRRLALVMNAGIFEPGGIPSGLHIEDGKTLLPLNEKPGQGNFYLQPNGVFFVAADGKTAGVLETGRFARTKPGCRLGLQSGPLLLESGTIHPAFRRNSTSRLHRNGVGIRRSDGKIVFAISDFQPAANRVNLHGFARLFAHLGCEDALFLDGDLSMMLVDPASPIPVGNHFGALLAVTEAGAAP